MTNYMNLIVDLCHMNISKNHMKYMLSRGFTEKTINDFKIGTFCPELIRAKVPMSFLEEHKIMFRNKHGGFWSEFDGRIIIPVNSYLGDPIAITGRILDGGKRAKYYNSVYQKSNVLFGLDRAKRGIVKRNAAIVVEGNLDVVAANECGVDNVVAVCGSAMTDRHVHLLLRYCDRGFLCFDNDEAGVMATARALTVMKFFSDTGILTVDRVHMPSGIKDVNDLMLSINKQGCLTFFNDTIQQSSSSNPTCDSGGWGWPIDE